METYEIECVILNILKKNIVKSGFDSRVEYPGRCRY